MTRRVAGERPDCEARLVDEAGVERAERAVRELVLEELEVGAQHVSLELGAVVLTSLSNATDSARDHACVLQELLVAVVLDDIIGASGGTRAGGACRSGRRPAPRGAPCRCQRDPRVAASARCHSFERRAACLSPPHAGSRAAYTPKTWRTVSSETVGCLFQRCMNSLIVIFEWWVLFLLTRCFIGFNK